MKRENNKYLWRFLILSISFSFLIRLIFLLQIPMIETDGVFYATLGRRLISTCPWEGIDAYWPPFYPFLIGVFSFIFKDLEFSGRIVSAVLGSLLLLPAFFLIREIFQEKVARLSVILMVFHPRLMMFSQEVLSEITYTCLVVAGIFTALVGFQRRKLQFFFFSGLIFGLSYLTRPEGFLIYILLSLWILCFCGFIWRMEKIKISRGLRFAVFSAGFLIFAFPYLLFVRKELGYWSISEKSGYNFYVSFSSEYEKYGLAPPVVQTSHQESREVAIKSDKTNFKPFSFIRAHPWVVGKKAMRNILHIVLDKIPSSLTYNFTLIMLSGIFLKRRKIPYKKEEIFLLSFIILGILGYSLFIVFNRFFTFLIPILVAWTSVGFFEWERVVGKRWNKLIFLFLLIPSIFYFSYKPMSREYDLEHKKAGIWLKTNVEESSVIMSRKPYAAFYSGNLIASIPDVSYETLVNYAKERKADYLIIDERYIPRTRPRLAFLLDGYLIPKELKMVYQAKHKNKKIIIYKWLL